VLDAFDPDLLPDGKLQRLYDYWLTRRREGIAPLRCDIDPVDIPELLPNLFLLDVIGDAEDFVFRLAGTLVEDAFSMALRGRSITETEEVSGTAIPVAHHVEVARGGGPRYREGMMGTTGREHWKIRRLLLPLSSDGRVVDVLMGGAVFLLGSQPNEVRGEPWSYSRLQGDPPLGT
jgi:hypothetical protein